MSTADEEVRAVPLWRRFHVKTTLLFGAPVLLLLTALAVTSTRFAVEAELDVLQARLEGLAVGLSRTIEVDTLDALRDAEDHGSAAHQRLHASFARIAALEPAVESIYVVRRTGDRETVAFAFDWVRRGTPATVGQRYDATQTDGMLRAFERPIVESRIYGDEWGRHLSGYAPIRDASGAVVAVVGIDMRADRVEQIEGRARLTTGAMYGIGVLLFVVGGALLGRNIRRPIARIIDATSAIARGEHGRTMNLTRTDELGLLAGRIDRMSLELEERERMRELFGRYVSEDVARRVLSSGDGVLHGAVEREVSALFIDLRRYSTITESLTPHEVLRLLNEYFSAMTDLVDAHRGCVIELLGDAILAVFGAPDPLEDHAAHAVRCALAMQARLEELNAEWEESGLAALWKARGIERLGARAAVHTGRVVAGTMGGDRRAKYAVLGQTVNAAMQLEAKNEELGTRVMISGEVLARLPAELAARAEPRGEHLLKGSEERVALYSML
jgi:class 3 adenylate cyclase